MLPDLFSFLKFVEREMVNHKALFNVLFKVKFLSQKMVDDVLLLVVLERLKSIIGTASVDIGASKPFGAVKDPKVQLVCKFIVNIDRRLKEHYKVV